MGSLILDLLLDRLIEPLVLGVGHFILGLVGIKPLQTKWLDATVAGVVGLGAWILAVLAIAFLVS